MESQRILATTLMDRAASGDEAAFGQLAGIVQDSLYRFALAQGLAGEDAAEAVQEALLRAWQRRSSWREHADAVSWMYGIAMNVVREFRRRRARSRPADVDLDLLAGAAEGGLRSDELNALAAALGKLPPRQREAVACRFLRQMSVRETAETMGCAEGTVKAAVFAALAAMRETLGPQ
jgi:RNA polymerase sigma-70 factor (ECF subfamily)